MPSIVVEPELYRRVEEAALANQTSVDQLMGEAVRRYLWELDRHKISEESRLYRERYAALRNQYAGQYIAMHDGKVVDHDPDFAALRARVRQQFGRTAVMVTLVGDTPQPTLIRRGFRREPDGA